MRVTVRRQMRHHTCSICMLAPDIRTAQDSERHDCDDPQKTGLFGLSLQRYRTTLLPPPVQQ